MTFSFWSDMSLTDNIISHFELFILYDRLLALAGLKRVYYAVHAILDAQIVLITYSEVWNTFTNFNEAITAPLNYTAVEMCVALHLYHIALYHTKLDPVEWAHHALMIGVALPLGVLIPSGSLLGFSLFFTTGLPGIIIEIFDFLSFNNRITRARARQTKAFLFLWIRAPGCCANAALIVVFLNLQGLTGYIACGAWIAAALMYWNGQYLAQMLVEANVKRQVS